jgi:hypothetical protein
MGTPTPDAVKRLIDRFDQDRKVFQSGDYKEEQLRAEFLNPFFESLGWDAHDNLRIVDTRLYPFAVKLQPMARSSHLRRRPASRTI